MNVSWKKIEPNNEIDKKLYKTFTNKIRFGYGEFGNKDTVLPVHFANIMDKCLNLDVKNSDIFVCSYPKTGTTWAQEMIWLIINNIDFNRAKTNLYARSPFLEVSGLFCYDDVLKTDDFTPKKIYLDSVNCVLELKDDRRIIKTHLPWHLLPKQIQSGERTPKIIYTTRNAKDTCVSYYYHCISREGYTGDFETFCDLFLTGRIPYGNFWSNVQSFYDQRNNPNMLIIKYEDMKQDLATIINKICSFLGKDLTENQLSDLVDHLSFDKMKQNPYCNQNNVQNRRFYTNNADGITFMRSGIVGSYKQIMSDEMIKKFDQWIETNMKNIEL